MSWFSYIIVPARAAHDVEAYVRAHGPGLDDVTDRPCARGIIGGLRDVRVYEASSILAFHNLELIPRGRRREAREAYQVCPESAETVRWLLALGCGPLGLIFHWASGPEGPAAEREQSIPAELLDAEEVILFENVRYIVQ